MWDASSATTSSELKPASLKRARMLSTVSARIKGIVGKSPTPNEKRTGLTERLWDEEVRRRLFGKGSAREKVELRSTRAVGERDSAGKLDEIASGDQMGLQERLQIFDRVTDTQVGG